MRYGLLGNPLGHSFSPRLHADYGTEGYELCVLPPDRLAEFFERREFAGVNVTIPYKRDVMALVDELHPSATECGAVNTVVNRGGRLLGYNTDAYGMRFALEHAGISLCGKHVLVLGSGGTSHTACALGKRENAASVTVVSRSGEVDYSSVLSRKEAQIVINATPVGMYPNAEASPLDLSAFPALEGVFDAVYNPLRTRLILQARALGLRVADGLLMLVAQAKASSLLFHGGEYSEPLPSEEAGREILRARLALARDLTNIVLVGMPSAGKSSLGRKLAEKLGRPFLDTDDLVSKRAGKSIPSIFASEGEGGFRAREAEVVAECAARSGVVIATGGGAPFSERNRLNLASNGFTVLVRRPLKLLETVGRPLSKDLATLAEMEKVRMPVYTAFCDAEVLNDGDLDECALNITEKFYENFCDQRS